MLLLVGLGNPGGKYQNHRHNVGFMAADAIADANGFDTPRKKFSGEIREGRLGSEKALVLKPLTYMNESGVSVGKAASFYKLGPENVIVFYDELDLAPGKFRIKTGGGAAGHNGIRSIDAHLGNGFRRARIGIGHPGDKSRVSGYVLGDFSKDDQDWLPDMLNALAAEASHLTQDDQRYASAVAQRLAPARNEKPQQTAKQNKPKKPPAVAEPQSKPENIFTQALTGLTRKEQD